jgi:outer membrane murein-binding lipoprotein Lpp
MKLLIASAVGALLLSGCAAEKTVDAPAGDTAITTTTTETVATSTAAEPPPPPAADSAVATTTNENYDSGSWTGQIKVAQPVSMFNYVGAESGDFAPMRFRNDSEAGKKILAACSNDDMCEFTGVVEWLDEVPPENASAVGQIIRVDSVKRAPATE